MLIGMGFNLFVNYSNFNFFFSWFKKGYFIYFGSLRFRENLVRGVLEEFFFFRYYFVWM